MDKRVLMITAHDVWGSVDTFSPLYKTIHYLAEEGYHIELVTIEKKSAFDRSSRLFGEPVGFMHRNVTINRIRVGNPRLLGIISRIPIIWRLIEKIRLESIFNSFVYRQYKAKLDKYDLIYAYEVFAVKIAKRLSVEGRLPIVTRFQGTFLLDWYNNYPHWLFTLKYKLHIEALSTPSDLIIMTDDGTQGDIALRMLENYKNVEFIKNGIDFDRMDIDKLSLRRKLHLPIDKYITISVSRLSKWKRLDRIVLAYDRLADHHKDYLHVFVGDGEEREHLLQECRIRNLQDKVIFIGQKNHEDVREYLCSADLFISLFDRTNVGNPLQEALKMELPILTYNVGDTNKLIFDGYNGVLLDDSSPQIVAESINRIRYDDEFRKRIIEGARETGKKLWSWEERLGYEASKISCLFEDNSNAQ